MIEKYRVIDGFDYQNEPCKLIEHIETEEKYSTENDLEANSLCKLLNEQEERIRHFERERCTTQKQHLKWSEQAEERIRELETRNKRQYERLKKIGDLMYKRDWEMLGLIVDKWEKEKEMWGHLW